MGRRALWLVGGEGIRDSPSPVLHNAALGDDRYSLHVDDDAERAFAAAQRECRGINVTAPFKIAAARRYATVLDEPARKAGAVNTVVYDDGGTALLAACTDIHGLLVAWHRAGFIVEGRPIAVVGGGGAARAVVVAAAEAGASGVVVHVRRREQAGALVALAATCGLDAAVADPGENGPASGAGARPQKCPLVVVAASGLEGEALGSCLDLALAPGGAVHELRYGARATPTRNAALSRRALYADGSSMLLAQAEAALALFQGSPLREEQRRAMSSTLSAWLRRR